MMGQKVAICGQFGAKSVQKCDRASHAQKSATRFRMLFARTRATAHRTCVCARTHLCKLKLNAKYRVLAIKSVQYSSAHSILSRVGCRNNDLRLFYLSPYLGLTIKKTSGHHLLSLI